MKLLKNRALVKRTIPSIVLYKVFEDYYICFSEMYICKSIVYHCYGV